MQSLAMSLILVGAALADSHPQGVKHIVLDMNVELVSLLGKPLYRTLPKEAASQKDLEAILAEAQKHVDAQPDNPAVYIELGQAYEGLWRYHDAAQAYTKSISLAPEDGTHFARRGYTFIVLRQFQQASNDFQHATVIAPQHADAWKGLGIAAYMMQKYEDAEKHLAHAMQLEPDNVNKAFIDRWLGVAERRLGKAPDPNTPRPSGILSNVDMNLSKYMNGIRKFLADDQAGALTDWREAASLDAWNEWSVIAAEVEIAMIEGTKKMKPLNEE